MSSEETRIEEELEEEAVKAEDTGSVEKEIEGGSAEEAAEPKEGCLLYTSRCV